MKLDLAKAGPQGALLAPLVQAACGENHVALQLAWRAVIDAGMPEAALRELTAPPFDEATALENGRTFLSGDSDAMDRLRTAWREVFAAKYRRVLELAQT